MGRINGKRYVRRFDKLEDSYKACEELWDRVYGKLPDHELANKYTGDDHPDTWLYNFYYFYNKS